MHGTRPWVSDVVTESAVCFISSSALTCPFFSALGIFVNWLANWVVAFSFPSLMKYTQPYTFLIFFGTTTFFLYFTKRFVPETKGKTVSQLAVEFDAMHLSIC